MAIDRVPYDWVIRFVVTLLLIFIFSCILLRPLWKLAMSRPSLIIVFSRAIGNYIQFFGAILQLFVNNIFRIPMTPDKSYYLAYSFSISAYIRIMSIAPHLHILALAINRLHAMFFPFHYDMVFAKKRNVYILCLCLWLICICVGGSDQLVLNLTNYTFSLIKLLNLKYFIYASGLCYTALGFRMLWMRHKSSSTDGISTEKDSIKILVVCFSYLQLVILPFGAFLNENFSGIPRMAVYWVTYCSQCLIYFTEEICLALLVREFRKNVKQQLRSVFCCQGSIESTSISILIKNNTARTEPIRVSQITKVNTLYHNGHPEVAAATSSVNQPTPSATSHQLNGFTASMQMTISSRKSVLPPSSSALELGDPPFSAAKIDGKTANGKNSNNNNNWA